MGVEGAALLTLLLVATGCRTTDEFNPFAEIENYDTVVIEDFEGPGTSGFQFAERVARSLSAEGVFSHVLRDKPESIAIRVQGKITRYSRGNPAMRLRYGHNVGNARFSVTVQLEDHLTGDFIASFSIDESYDWTNDRSRIHQELDTLSEKAAQTLAAKIAEWVE